MGPKTQYAKSGEVGLAYQVVGDGPFDLVLVPGFVSNAEYAWEDPGLAAFYGCLGAFCRLIVFDKRGTGLPTGCTACRPWRRGWTTCAPSWTQSAPSGPHCSVTRRARR